MKQTNDHRKIMANSYCYLNDEGAVFLNRWDEHIKQFRTFKEASDYAYENLELIDVKIKKL